MPSRPRHTVAVTSTTATSISFVKGDALVVVSADDQVVSAPPGATTSTSAKTAAGRL